MSEITYCTEDRKRRLSMKFNKIITVMMLCGIGFATQNSVQAHAMTEATTVISDQSTLEKDISGYELADGTAMEIVTGNAVTVTEAAVTTGSTVSTFSQIDVTANASDQKLSESIGMDQFGVNDEVVKMLGDTDVAQAINTEPVVSKKTVSTKLSNISTKTKRSTKKKYTASELKLMSSIIYCEAVGEPYAGKLAVGIVVMNRKSSKSFPNTVKGVIYQKYQFGPTRNGSLSRALKRYEAGQFKSKAEKDCIKAAKAALEGTKKVTYKSKSHNLKTFHFFSTRVSGARLKIQNHQFK